MVGGSGDLVVGYGTSMVRRVMDIAVVVTSVAYEKCMIIFDGRDADGNMLSRGMIYDARIELWTPLPNDMPKSLHCFGIAGNDK